MNFFDVLLGVFAVLMLVPATVFFVQVLMALPAYRPRHLPQGRRPSVCLLIPAHNEAAVIAGTLRSIVPQLAKGDRLLVVADNCSDETAEIARGLGAEVIERQDLEHRGKGYALDFGIRHMRHDPPEVVIVIDADCQVHPGAIDRLSRTCAQAMRPVQALYLMNAPAGAGLKTRIAEFAWVVKNQVRPLGYRRLGLPCQLMGTGMAFPWALLSQARLANGNIVEDMKLGIDLAVEGFPAIFCPEAQVSSFFPDGKHAEATQRTRWEHGHLSTILHELPRLLVQAAAKADIRLLGLALDLAVPPLALLVILLSVVFAFALAGMGMGLSTWPFLLSSIALGLLMTAVLLAWHGWGRQVISFADLLSVPFYVLSKITLYLKFWTRRQKAWVRTDRD